MNQAIVFVVLFWGGQTPGITVKAHTSFSAACVAQRGAKDEFSQVLEVRHAPSMMTYTVNCTGFDCPAPPPFVAVRKVECVFVPASKKVVEVETPGAWVEKP